MTISVEAPRGGLAEDIGGKRHVLLLRNGEIERFEDKHRGIFETWDGFLGRATVPNSREIRDIIALGLVGGGMKDVEADKVVAQLGPADMLNLFAIARALVGVAFMPDVGDQNGKKK